VDVIVAAVAAAVTVMVEAFTHLTVVPAAPVADGIKYKTIDVPAATFTVPVNVLEVVLVPVVPNAVRVPPLLEYCTSKLQVPLLTAVLHTILLSVKV